MRSCINLLLLGVLFCTACQKDEIAALKAAGCANCINFQALEVGQESRYVAFEGEKFWEEQPVFHYLNDTLIVKVTGKTGDLFEVEEYRTSNASDLLHYTFQVKSDTLYVKMIPRNNYPESWLFNSIGAIKLPLNTISQPIVEMKGWQIPLFGEESPAFGSLKNYQQLGSTYDILNVYQNYEPMTYDGPGYYVLYGKNFGVVRSVSINPWQAKGLGWDLLQ